MREGVAVAHAAAAFSASDYEAAKRRVRRLDTPNETHARSGSASGLEVGGGAAATAVGGGGRGSSSSSAGFIDKLQHNISEIRVGIIRKLESNPALKTAVDSDIKEMQLHIDRLLLHQVSEKDSASKMTAELKQGYDTELELVKKHHEDELERLKQEHFEKMRSLHERCETAEQKAAGILADCAAEVGRREREVEIAWRGRVEALTVQLNSDMVATREKMVNDVREQYEREKREAMVQLTDELIPKIEAEVAETHSVEVERYQRRIEDERKKGEARAKQLEEQLAKVKEELAETIQAMAEISSANAQDAAAREKLQEVLADNLRLRKELSARSEMIKEQENSIAGLESAVVGAEDEIMRLQAAVANLAADREAADHRALLQREAASSEVEQLRTATTELQERHVAELHEIRVRVRRAVDAKEKERLDLAKRLEEAERRIAETEAVLERAHLDIGAL